MKKTNKQKKNEKGVYVDEESRSVRYHREERSRYWKY